MSDKNEIFSGENENPDIEHLMKSYGNDVLRLAYSYVSDKHMAEDLFQEVFIKVFRMLDTFRNESSIRTWILKITANTCKDYLKSAYSKRVVPMMDFAEDAIVSENDFEQVENADTAKLVKDAVMSLPENQREVVILVYYHENSLEEASLALDVPVGTVKSRLARARQALKEKLERRL